MCAIDCRYRCMYRVYNFIIFTKNILINFIVLAMKLKYLKNNQFNDLRFTIT